jgi:hypothetical protein
MNWMLEELSLDPRSSGWRAGPQQSLAPLSHHRGVWRALNPQKGDVSFKIDIKGWNGVTRRAEAAAVLV